MDLAAVGVIVAIVAGGVALLGLAAFGARGSLLKATNEMLEKALDAERTERAASEARCANQIAELRGQVSALTPQFAKTIATEVIKVFRDEGVLPARGGGR